MMGCVDPTAHWSCFLRPHIEIRLCYVSLPEGTIKLPLILGWNPMVLLGYSEKFDSFLLVQTPQFLCLKPHVWWQHPNSCRWTPQFCGFTHHFWWLSHDITILKIIRFLLVKIRIFEGYFFLAEINPMCFLDDHLIILILDHPIFHIFST